MLIPQTKAISVRESSCSESELRTRCEGADIVCLDSDESGFTRAFDCVLQYLNASYSREPDAVLPRIVVLGSCAELPPAVKEQMRRAGAVFVLKSELRAEQGADPAATLQKHLEERYQNVSFDGENYLVCPSGAPHNENTQADTENAAVSEPSPGGGDLSIFDIGGQLSPISTIR